MPREVTTHKWRLWGLKMVGKCGKGGEMREEKGETETTRKRGPTSTESWFAHTNLSSLSERQRGNSVYRGGNNCGWRAGENRGRGRENRGVTVGGFPCNQASLPYHFAQLLLKSTASPWPWGVRKSLGLARRPSLDPSHSHPSGYPLNVLHLSCSHVVSSALRPVQCVVTARNRQGEFGKNAW